MINIEPEFDFNRIGNSKKSKNFKSSIFFLGLILIWIFNASPSVVVTMDYKKIFIENLLNGNNKDFLKNYELYLESKIRLSTSIETEQEIFLHKKIKIDNKTEIKVSDELIQKMIKIKNGHLN